VNQEMKNFNSLKNNMFLKLNRLIVCVNQNTIKKLDQAQNGQYPALGLSGSAGLINSAFCAALITLVA
jgi:hypothetical protein